jgi:hypothetical protein
LASPEADKPFSAASVSSARQISSCFMHAVPVETGFGQRE